MIKLKKTTGFLYNGDVFSYLAVYDHDAGRDNRYTLMIETSEDPVIIGREIDLKLARELITDYENEAICLSCYLGKHKDVLRVMKRVMRVRKKRFG